VSATLVSTAGTGAHGTPGPALILGGSGFLGAALGATLEKAGWSVEAPPSRELDLRRPEAAAALAERLSPETILIFSSAVTPDRGDTLENLSANLRMIEHVAEGVAARPPAKVVYVSSDAVYPFDDERVSEETPIRTETYYALSKHVGEQVMARTAGEAGIRLLTLRPTAVFGPGNTHGSYGPNRFIRQILTEGVVKLFGQGEERRDHLYIEDAVRFVQRLLEKEATGVLNLVSGESRSFGEVAEALRRVTSRRFEVQPQPRRGPITYREFDVSKLKAAMGGMKITPFDEALRETFMAEELAR
jgi:UDP-glucose 4-epimerase